LQHSRHSEVEVGCGRRIRTAREKSNVWSLARIASLCFFISACADTPSGATLKPTIIVRGVDSSTRQVVDSYYSVEPDCSNPGYPEIKFLRMPNHGTVAVENGEVYPNFSKDNVRYDCNKKRVATSQITYESVAGFHGSDSFTIQVRFNNSNLRLVTYNVDVI
jgi:hypothetical protein